MSQTGTTGRQNIRLASGWSRFLIALAGGALLGVGIAALSPGAFFPGWLAASFLSVAALFFLYLAWKWAGGGRLLAWMIGLAFFLRLLLGIGLSVAIANWGYDNECQNAGYLFKDACKRDSESFAIARNDQVLFWFSGTRLGNDQYGGLAFLSGWIYRYLSPDAHRSFLILIAGSFFAALGIPFLRQTVRLHWSQRTANITAWIAVLYPDALFFASSQMREPFLVGLSAVALWAALNWDRSKRTSLFVLAASLLGMLFFSSKIALIIGGILAILVWLEITSRWDGRKKALATWLGLLAGVFIVLIFTWDWFKSSSDYDILLTIRSSGSLTARIKEIGEQWTSLFTIIYGITRPFLPAAIADSDSLPLMRWIGIVRSLGWYILVPFLVYGLFTLWREPDPRMRRMAVWLCLSVVLWLLIASARGGGDATDNPRYRSLLINWMALMGAWSLDGALRRKDVWLWRWIAVEAIFLGFFTHWYIGRYYRIWARLEFWPMVFWIAGLSGLVLAGGWLYDRLRSARKPH